MEYPNLLTISPAAKERISGLAAEEKMRVLRVFVKGGGCAGFTYQLALEKEPQEDDILTEQEGFTLAVDPFSAALLAGTSLDWKESLLEQAFVFENPNAVSTCGCGSSFSVG